VHYAEREFWGVNFNEFKSGMTQEKHAAAINLELGNHFGICQENDKQGNQCRDDQSISRFKLIQILSRYSSSNAQ
jgi:hypothetical protein